MIPIKDKLCGLDKRFGSKFRVGPRVRQETLEESRRLISQNVVNITIKMKTIV